MTLRISCGNHEMYVSLIFIETINKIRMFRIQCEGHICQPIDCGTIDKQLGNICFVFFIKLHNGCFCRSKKMGLNLLSVFVVMQETRNTYTSVFQMVLPPNLLQDCSLQDFGKLQNKPPVLLHGRPSRW